MRTFCELPTDGLRRARPRVLLTLFGLALAACGGGGGGSDNNATPPPPPPPPPPGGNVPPLSSTVIDVTNGQQIGSSHWGNGNTSTGGQGQPMAGLDCIAPGSIPNAYHVHTHLSIFLNGQALTIPAGIGFVSQGTPSECNYPLHTHSLNGLLHVHGTAPGTFTLGQIFQIWGQPLSSADIAGLTSMPVRVFVVDNGVVTENTGDWSAIELTSHRTITIQVGTDIAEVPNVTWSGL
jgi:hypothetical protein